MSLEQPEPNKQPTRREVLRNLAMPAAMIGSAAVGGVWGAEGVMEKVNEHTLSPFIIKILKAETGATDAQIVLLEKKLIPLIVNELQEIIRRERGSI
jgi:hypothetical protein